MGVEADDATDLNRGRATQRARKKRAKRTLFKDPKPKYQPRKLLNTTAMGLAELERRRETAERVARILQQSGIKLDKRATKSLDAAAQIDVAALAPPPEKEGDDVG